MENGGSITIRDRASLVMTSVSEVLTFDEDFVSVMTALGKVEIEGGGLRILNLSSESGDFHLEGRIDGVYYAAKPKKGLFSRKGA